MVSLSSVITYQDVLCAVKFNSNNKSAEYVVRSGDRPKYPMLYHGSKRWCYHN